MKGLFQSEDFKLEHDAWYIAFTGWLILPAVYTLLLFFGSWIMLLAIDPSELSGFDLVVYYSDVVMIPYLLVTYILWFKRKKLFPLFMIIFFAYIGILSVTYYYNGHPFDPVKLVMSLVWIIYFIRSKRVKLTFVR